MAVAKIARNFDCATNLHPNPTDFAHEICIRRMQILAGSITSLFIIIITIKIMCMVNSSKDIITGQCAFSTYMALFAVLFSSFLCLVSFQHVKIWLYMYTII